jgi:hypothetical protein
MIKSILISTVFILFFGCSASKKIPKTMGDIQNAESFGYQPLDPLPVELKSIVDSPMTNKRLMNSLPDETMRLAIGQVDSKGNISFGPAKIGYAGSSYIVILDYVKFDTKSFPVQVAKDTNNTVIDFRSISDYDAANSTPPDAVIPVYVGVGLRFTATIQVNEGKVDLGNLFALGLAAESKKVTGTLIIQTLGISGETISTLIPMPSQINTTTIQNAIMALASIKAKIYETDAQIHPRVVGFYNNLGGGQKTVNRFISSVLSRSIPHLVR